MLFNDKHSNLFFQDTKFCHDYMTLWAVNTFLSLQLMIKRTLIPTTRILGVLPEPLALVVLWPTRSLESLLIQKLLCSGVQTVYDTVVSDTFLVLQLTVAAFSTVAVLTRFEDVSSLANQSQHVVFAFCLIYNIPFVAMCVHLGLTNLLR